jgi:hypothetical protein
MMPRISRLEWVKKQIGSSVSPRSALAITLSISSHKENLYLKFNR